MILASDFATKAYGAIRVVLMWIDSLGFYFIDNAYKIMIRAMEGFNQEAIQQIAGKMIRSAYVLMGIFALFRIAIMLINAIINPDKLTDKKEGAGNVLFHFVGTIFLLIFIPFIFDAGRDLQSRIIKGNYIPKFILGQEIASGSSSNAGAMLQRITVKSMIRPDDRLADRETSYEYIDSGTGLKTGETCSKDNLNKPKSKEEKNIICQEITEYKANSECSNNNECKKAVDNWIENKVRFRTLSKYIDSYVKVNGEAVYVYEYTPFLTLVVGLFMTYVLASFTIDIAVRSVELLVLEVLSPLFTITFIDPKMASSGPFKKWVTATGKSYASLFIKVAIISLILLLLSNLHTLVNSVVFGSENNWIIELFMVLAILIFAKKAPKWLGDMLGLSDGAGLGGLGIGKKLAGAALVGGALTKAGHAAFGAADNARKNLTKSMWQNHESKKLARKNTGGSMTRAAWNGLREARNGGSFKDKYSQLRKDYKNSLEGSKSNFLNAGKKNIASGIAGIITGGQIGFSGKDLNDIRSQTSSASTDFTKEARPGYKPFSERISGKIADSVSGLTDYGYGNGNYRADLKKVIKDNDEAQQYYTSNVLGKDGQRNPLLYPQGNNEMNAAWHNPTTREAVQQAIVNNLTASGTLSINSNGTYTDGHGRNYNNASEYYSQHVTPQGNAAVEALLANNRQQNAQGFVNADNQIQQIAQSIVAANQQIMQAASSSSNAQSSLNRIEQRLKEGNMLSEAANSITNERNRLEKELNIAREQGATGNVHKLELELAKLDNKEKINKSLQQQNQNYISNLISADNTGIVQMAIDRDELRRNQSAWKNVKDKYENEFNTHASEYEFEIQGEKRRLGKDFTHTQEIIAELGKKVQKAEDRLQKLKKPKDK